MKNITKIKYKTAAEQALHYTAAALGYVVFVGLYPITGPWGASRVVKKTEEKAASQQKQLSEFKKFKIGARAFFTNLYFVPKNIIASIQQKAQKSYQARMEAYNEHLNQTGVSDLLQIINGNDIEFRDVKFIKQDGEVMLKQCWCVKGLAIYTDKNTQRCGVFDNGSGVGALSAEDFLDIPTDLFEDVCSAIEARYTYQQQQIASALEQETNTNRERIAAERQRKYNQRMAELKATIAKRAQKTN